MSSPTIEQPGRIAEGTVQWDKTFPKSDRVDHQRVTFTNRIGIELVADYYLPRNHRADVPLAAIIVGHPYGGVKEQTSGLYAQTLAERGFATLAFDASFNGESGGTPRSISSPEIFSEDFSAAVDFLGTRSEVHRSRIGVLGVCGSGGFALSAAQFDPRMRAVATVSMYDMGRAIRQGLNDTVSEAERRELLAKVAEQRWSEYGDADLMVVPGSPKELTDETPAVGREFFDYYRTPRGQHPRSSTAFSFTSLAPMMRFRPFEHLADISPRPVLFVAGADAHSRYFSEDAYALAVEPKALHIVPDAGHVDLYDRVDLIPWDVLASFFATHLTREAS